VSRAASSHDLTVALVDAGMPGSEGSTMIGTWSDRFVAPRSA
jgi:hypothetical protein